MANEIKFSVRTSIIKDQYAERFDVAKNYDQTGIGSVGGIQIIPTAGEVITLGDIVTEGYMFLKHLGVDNTDADTTNYFEFGPAADATSAMSAFGKLQPDEFAILRLSPGKTYKWQADTGQVKAYYLILED